MSGIVLRLCRLCAGADPRLPAALRAALDEAGHTAALDTAACMSGCARGPTLSVRAPGKMAYLFGEFGRADIPDLLTFLALYDAAPDGDLADARPIGQLRFKAIARIPG